MLPQRLHLLPESSVGRKRRLGRWHPCRAGTGDHGWPWLTRLYGPEKFDLFAALGVLAGAAIGLPSGYAVLLPYNDQGAAVMVDLGALTSIQLGFVSMAGIWFFDTS